MSPRRKRSARSALGAALLLLTVGADAAARPADGAVAEAGPLAARLAAERLPDGSQLVTLRRAGGIASLRIVVGSGARDDPAERAGLAHLLEHVVFHGGGDAPGQQFRREAWVAGATLNAFTTVDRTVYQLDAPTESFERLATRFVGLVTDPDLTDGALAHEKLVVSFEPRRSPVGLAGILHELLFSRSAGRAPLGLAAGRAAVTAAELREFFQRNYTADNLTFVVVGPLESAAARALVTSATRLPPALPGEARSRRPEALQLPLREVIPYSDTATVVGYALDEGGAGSCAALSIPLERRLVKRIAVEEALASRVEVSCERIEGRWLLLAWVFSRSAGAGRVPELLEEAFASLGRDALRSVSAAQVTKALRARESLLLMTSPGLFADELSFAVAGEGGFDPATAHPPPTLDGPALEALAKRSFVPERQIYLSLGSLGM